MFIFLIKNGSDYSDYYLSDKNENDIYNPLCINQILDSNLNDNISDNNPKAIKILNNMIQTEKIFDNNSKDFIDEEMEKERKSLNIFKKSIDTNPNNSVMNNMTLSYSISSNEKSDGKKIR